ncbi:hypothetical protein [Agriterribacter sp.]|uniref:hypothetical protein n=1 Tax=Agriterribacter sp. TaxID=2821509 RepID=UPI002B96F215|nr:hypothetical protein [Agriterribacter sp.]HRO48369.1 hypothetical protein [Agriterribacter sp.]HRQ19376.1 hypothetical protein [Agriterribacter sp.]
MKPIIICLALYACIAGMLSCGNASIHDSLFSKYRDNKEPVPFAPGLAIKGNTYKGCFSNDYATFYFFRHQVPNREDYRIYQSAFTGSKWKEPELIRFSDSVSDLYPVISTIEKDKLFFISYRRTPGDTSAKPNGNFWTSSKVADHWQPPVPFAEANLIYNYNSQPCITANGTIYFTSHTPDWSKTLTYKMVCKNGHYQNPEPFHFVNQLRQEDTGRTVFEIAVSPDESYMVLTIAENRQDARLFVSRKTQQAWTAPIYIGNIIKGDMTGNFPYITADGEFLIFTRHFDGFFILPAKAFLKGIEIKEL